MQQYEEDPAVLYSSPHARGIIQPYSTELIPVVFQAKKVDSLQQTAYIAVLGRKDPPLVSEFSILTLGFSRGWTVRFVSWFCAHVF